MKIEIIISPTSRFNESLIHKDAQEIKIWALSQAIDKANRESDQAAQLVDENGNSVGIVHYRGADI